MAGFMNYQAFRKWAIDNCLSVRELRADDSPLPKIALEMWMKLGQSRYELFVERFRQEQSYREPTLEECQALGFETVERAKDHEAWLRRQW